MIELGNIVAQVTWEYGIVALIVMVIVLGYVHKFREGRRARLYADESDVIRALKAKALPPSALAQMLQHDYELMAQAIDQYIFVLGDPDNRDSAPVSNAMTKLYAQTLGGFAEIGWEDLEFMDDKTLDLMEDCESVFQHISMQSGACDMADYLGCNDVMDGAEDVWSSIGRMGNRNAFQPAPVKVVTGKDYAEIRESSLHFTELKAALDKRLQHYIKAGK